MGAVALWFLPALALATAVHEAGHLLAAWLCGFRFVSVGVGPLVLRRLGRRFTVRLERGTGAAGFAGVASVNPHNLRARLLLFIAGGPIASILLVVIGFSLHPKAAEGYLHVGLCIQLARIISALNAFVSILPMRDLGGRRNDASQIVVLLRDGPEAKRFCAMAVLGGLQGAQVHPREWDPNLIQQATALHDYSFDDAIASMTAYSWADQRDDFIQAGFWIDRALATRYSATDAAEGAILLDAAFHEACHRQNPDGATQLLDEARRLPLDRCQLLRTEAAISLAEEKRLKSQTEPPACLASASSSSPVTRNTVQNSIPC